MSAGMIVLAFFIGILVMLILITIHELGHFIVAKMSKAYVYEFSIGFGPRLYTFKGKETWVSIRAFPLGGFCSIASDKSDPPTGREDEVVPDERKLDYIARWKKMFFILAGPFMNLVIAITLFTLTFAITMVKTDDMSYFGAKYNKDQIAYKLLAKAEENNGVEINQDFVIWGWQTKAQLLDAYTDPKNNEKIIFDNIDGNDQKINDKDNKKAVSFEKTVYTFLDNLNKEKDEYKETPVQIRFAYKVVDKYTGEAKVNELKWTDWSDEYKYEDNKAIAINENETLIYKYGDGVGIAAPDRIFKNSTVAYGYGWKETFNSSVAILKSFSMLFTGNINQLAGPVGVAKQTATMISSPTKFFLYVASISANLFILNLIFIPPLDGYRLIENFIEMIIKKELNGKFKMIMYISGAILFLILFAVITVKDFII